MFGWAILLATAGAEISPEGQKLAAFFDGLHVDQKWLPGGVVKWESGVTIQKLPNDGKPHTHCSAFAASACKKLGVYLLRPPEHSSTHLANAQADWLAGDGKAKGWAPVADAAAAQAAANRGKVVVAVFKEGLGRHGHVALVRPAEKTAAMIVADGPQIIQAGMENHVSATFRAGFKHHPAALAGGVKFYAHDATIP